MSDVSDVRDVNPYGRLLTTDEVADGGHRRMVGGMWDAVGELQARYLVEHGLTPDMRLVDVGCGALRGGVHLVGYLDPGHYYGIDRNASLLDAGYDVELAAAGLRDRLPRAQLVVDDDFGVDRFGVAFDVALAHSLFTHLPATHVRRCLRRVAGALRPGGRLFATFYEAPPGTPPDAPVTHRPGGITTFADRNPFHVTAADLVACADGLPLVAGDPQRWGHPRAQRMICFERT